MVSNFGPTLKGLKDLEFAQKEWKPALEILAGKLAAGSAKAFGRETGPDGYKWPQVGEDYGRTKSVRALLHKTGRLQAIATKTSKTIETLTNTRLVYEIDVPYATTHQFGSSPKPQTGFGGARVRNYLIWGKPMEQLVHKTLSDYGAERTRKIRRRMGW
jgi:phage gpG-like protein